MQPSSLIHSGRSFGQHRAQDDSFLDSTTVFSAAWKPDSAKCFPSTHQSDVVSCLPASNCGRDLVQTYLENKFPNSLDAHTCITSFSLALLISSIFLISSSVSFWISSSARFSSSSEIFLSFKAFLINSLPSRRILRTAVR